MTVIFQGRTFSLWSYSVSMGQLTLRSTSEHSSPPFDTRIDVKFQDVQAIKLPAVVSDMRVKRLEQQATLDHANAEGIEVNPANIACFLVSGHQVEGYVFAGAGVYVEDFGKFSEPSAAWPYEFTFVESALGPLNEIL